MVQTAKKNNLDGFQIKLFNSLPLKFKPQINKLWYDNFRAGKSQREIKEGEDKFFSSPFALLLAIEKNYIIGTVRLFNREVSYNKKKVILGGVGGVCTRKDRRKRGIATTLLKRAMEELNAKKCDIVFLCTDASNPKRVRLYSQVGFVILKKPYVYFGRSGERYIEKNGMIAPLRSRVKFNLIINGKKLFNIGNGNW